MVEIFLTGTANQVFFKTASMISPVILRPWLLVWHGFKLTSFTLKANILLNCTNLAAVEPDYF